MVEWHYSLKKQKDGERLCNIDIKATADYKNLFATVLESDVLDNTNPLVKGLVKAAKRCLSSKMVEHLMNKNAETVAAQVNKVLKKQAEENGFPSLKVSKRI